MRLTLLLILSLASIPGQVEGALIALNGSLSAANLNGTDPARITDPNGVVPTTATGTFIGVMDTNTLLLDFSLAVDGIRQADLRNFGPNSTPIHLHLANGDPGNFGPIAVDLTLNAVATDFTDSANGFTLARNGLSIALADQGGVTLGMHPGDALIADALQSGNAFALVHTNNPAIPAFPFGEIRGNLTAAAVPEPSGMLALALVGGVLTVRRRR